MNQEKINQARAAISELEHQQAGVYAALVEELDVAGMKENHLFDYIHNSGTEQTFEEYCLGLKKWENLNENYS